MGRRAPPFSALRALEAACRHRNYSAAAAELDITHSAISQSVRRLEDEVGAKLFVRRGAAMEPTSQSVALAAAYAEAAHIMDRTLRQVSDRSSNSLTLTAPARLARMWLSPLLPDLAQRFSHVNLCIATEGLADPNWDVAIQTESPRLGFEAKTLTDPRVRAYASPALSRRLRLQAPADLLAAPLLVEGDGTDWADWFKAAGLAHAEPLVGVRFDDQTGLALESAIRGAGVALGDSLSVRGALDRGELEPICPDIVIEGRPAWIVWRSDHASSGLIAPLAAWLQGQARFESVTPSPLPALTRLSA